jgi:hypothetical protein
MKKFTTIPLMSPLTHRVIHKHLIECDQNTYTQIAVKISYEDKPCDELLTWLTEYPRFALLKETVGDVCQYRVVCHTDEDAVLFRLRWELI